MEFSENSMDDGFSDQYPDVVAIFPPEDGELDLTQFPPIIYAQEDLSRLPSGSREEEVNVVIDDEVNDQVVELLGVHANLGFSLKDMDLPYLVFHLKNMYRFMRMELTILDTKNNSYDITASNKQTLVMAKKQSCSLPIQLNTGWNRVCLNLPDICSRAFGVEYQCTTVVRIYANCRIWRLFFQDRNYADDQLPVHLRVVDK